MVKNDRLDEDHWFDFGVKLFLGNTILADNFIVESLFYWLLAILFSEIIEFCLNKILIHMRKQLSNKITKWIHPKMYN